MPEIAHSPVASAPQICRTHFERCLDAILMSRWPSYLLLALLQTKIVWNAWLYRDLTIGDTSGYFRFAYRWYEGLADNIIRSPLYTAYYGSVLGLTSGDVYAATTLHRILITLVATLGVLAVMRRLLPPAIALLLALWWACLPGNFDVLYEVHLFSLIPVLVACLVAMSGETTWYRSITLAVLAAATLVVRLELVVATAVFALACFVQERRRGGWRGRLDATSKYGIPLLISLAVWSFFYLRSDVGLGLAAERRLGENMCQVYAYGYQQRHAAWALNPWTECQTLMQTTFGRPTPTLWQMAAANPTAVLEHFWWNISLTPSGLQLALFNTIFPGKVSPDFIPVTRSPVALYLSLAVAAIVGLAVVVGLGRGNRWRLWFRRRANGWIVLLAVFSVAVPVILTQRPRPSYLFPTTLVLFAIIGTAVHIVTQQNRAALALKVLAVCGGLTALVFIPPYYPLHPGRPLLTSYDILQPFSGVLRDPNGRVVLGDYSFELANYLLIPRQIPTLDYGLLAKWDRREELGDFLDRAGINVIYFQPRIVRELRNEPQARPLLTNPEVKCWKRLGQGTIEGSEWLLIRHERAGSGCAVLP